MKKRLLGIVSACLLAGVAQAEAPVQVKGSAPFAGGQTGAPVQVKESAPDRYTVVAGDTLWGIAGRYLNDPWRWPEIWEANKQVYNPHLIYPGDVLLLCRIKGNTVLAVDQGGGCAEIEKRISNGGGVPTQTEMPDGTVKLHPQVRELPLSLAIPAIPLKEIQRYLNDSRVVSAEELDAAPYVLSAQDNRVVAGKGDKIYVRNKNQQLVANGSYGIYRGGQRYVDPDTGKILGYEAEDLGAGSLTALNSEVGTLMLTRSVKEVIAGDKLLPTETGRISSVFHPANPEGVKSGRIVRVFDSISSAAQYSVIVLNRGEVDGVKPGHVFTIFHAGGLTTDSISKEAVRLPAEEAGMAMVFRTFPKVSYALILRSSTTIKNGDEVRPPISGD